MRWAGWRVAGRIIAATVVVLISTFNFDVAPPNRPSDDIRPPEKISSAVRKARSAEGPRAGVGSGLIYLDPDLAPENRPRALANARSTGTANPVFLMLKDGLEKYRSEWGGLPKVAIPVGVEAKIADRGPVIDALFERLGTPRSVDGRFDRALSERVQAFQATHGLDATGVANAQTIAALNRGSRHYEAIIRSNIKQARSIVLDPGTRFIFVNTAATTLTAYERGEPVLTMDVAVGTADRPTPALADKIETIVVNPRWNVPPHLVRDSIAPGVMRKGLDYLDEHNLVVLTDWTEEATRADPLSVDWRAVSQGQTFARVRQKPGAANPMGRVKFMFPNRLGIYLHDTPDRISASHGKRYVTNGCVRLERPGHLARFLAGPEIEMGEFSGSTRRIELPRPVPVFIMHLTFALSDGKPTFYPDEYG